MNYLGLQQIVEEVNLPVCVYDIKVSSSDGNLKDMLASRKGKVTLFFNVAAGCGNIPQHSVLEQLNKKYEKVDDFGIIAVTVDDFVCHGYPEFQNGLEAYIEENKIDLTPGQVAKKYAQDNFGVTYDFTELTNGRHDKHTYDKNYVPGSVKVQEQHELWKYLTGAYSADIAENGVPYHDEDIPWSYAEPIKKPENAKSFFPLRGNFEKFLVSKDGKKIKRYANGFLLGERDVSNNTFPWIEEKYKEDGRRDHAPKASDDDEKWPNKVQRRGIELSLDIISSDIDLFLSE
ncbi:BtuE Glutathione peroxidase [uncultured Caudovirales phage]|uniref:BtuE Glutathione peroxidase n=1 Tax=uncultured Caudovirales phage TaxID=2100421 RepID=A0A6J5NDB2_9CAUD|nr:BtuE Glutathione peroxidase [uncultured Caudovirales phage]